MYSCDLKIFLSGIDSGLYEAIQKIKPLENFAHSVCVANSLSELKAPKSDALLINSQESGISPEAQRGFAGPENLCVYCCAEPALLTESQLEAVDVVWPWPLPVPLAIKLFGNLQKELKDKKELWLTQSYLQAMLDTLPDMVWFKRLDGIHLKVNQAFCDVVKKPISQIEGKDHPEIWNVSRELFEKGEFSCQKSDNETIESRKMTISEEKVMMENSLHTLKTFKAPVFSEDHEKVIGTVGIARDVTREYQYRDRILEMAHTDYLTGFANRRYMYEFVGEQDTEHGMTLCFCDIDDFKNINDVYGHLIGDAALITTARVIKDAVPDAFFVRLGGDEFLLIFFTQKNVWTLAQTFEDVNLRLKTALENISLSISVGIASTDSPDATLEEMISRSDAALYRAKFRKNACVIETQQ